MASKNDPVLILGAGTFGLAAAHALASAGYTDVTVLEKDECVPSRFSGGFDMNKVIRAEYIDPFYTDLALKAIRKWQTDGLYQPHFHQVGFLNVVTGEAGPGPRNALAKYRQSVTAHPGFAGQIEDMPDAAAIRGRVRQFTGALPGWHGYLNRQAGYAHSSNAMQAVYEASQRLGVRFRLGRAGAVEALLYDGPGGKCAGARTQDGQVHRAATTIVALGGSVAAVVPAMARQVVASCWGVSHIQLTPAESEQLRGMPVTSVRDIGFFFEPDPATHKLKMVHMGGSYTRYVDREHTTSLPYATLHESAYMPEEDVVETRRLLRQALPHLADRPLIDQHLCWIADAPSSDFILDFVPGAGRSLAVLSGDSGHGFKMLPIMGDLVVDLLAAGAQHIARWRWTEPQAGQQATSPTWRASAQVDLSTMARAKL